MAIVERFHPTEILSGKQQLCHSFFYPLSRMFSVNVVEQGMLYPPSEVVQICGSMGDGRDVPVSLVVTEGYHGHCGPVIVQACRFHA